MSGDVDTGAARRNHGAASFPKESATSATSSPQSLLDRIPLTLRMWVYGVSFLVFILVGLPWLAYRVDFYWPAWRVEIGPLRWIGAPLFLLFFVIYVTSSAILSRRGRGAYVEFDPPREFVATGPFRWCRNPIAGSLVAMLWALAITFSSTGILLLSLLAVPLAHLQVIALEEPLLRKRFGAAYERYLRTVPRWIPRPPLEGGA